MEGTAPAPPHGTGGASGAAGESEEGAGVGREVRRWVSDRDRQGGRVAALGRSVRSSLQHGVYGLDVGEDALPVGFLHRDHVVGVQQRENPRQLTVDGERCDVRNHTTQCPPPIVRHDKMEKQ